MAKKRIKQNKNKSILKKLFTFPKVFIYSVIVLGIFSYFQINSSQRVMGIWDYSGVSTTSESEAKTANQLSSMQKVIFIRLVKDKNENAKLDSDESCLGKAYKVKWTYIKDGKTVVSTKTLVGNSTCEQSTSISVTAKCNTVEFINALSNWKVTGLTYSDGDHSDTTLKGKSAVKMCGYTGPNEGIGNIGYQYLDFGLKQK